MPKATVNHDTEKFDLKTCPGGYVELRTLSFGELLKRRQIATEISMQGSSRKTAKTTMDIMAEQVALFDFKNCIVSHNLEDDGGNPLDFRSAAAIAKLDPKIGAEIDSLIDKMNNFNPEEGDDELGNSPSALKPV